MSHMGTKKRLLIAEKLSVISLMEWELGSRSMSELVGENMPVIGKGVLMQRLSKALPPPKPKLRINDWGKIGQYIGKFVRLYGEKDTVYYAHYATKGLIYCQTVLPTDQAGARWNIHPDSIKGTVEMPGTPKPSLNLALPSGGNPH